MAIVRMYRRGWNENNPSRFGGNKILDLATRKKETDGIRRFKANHQQYNLNRLNYDGDAAFNRTALSITKDDRMKVISSHPINKEDFRSRKFHFPLTTKASNFAQLHIGNDGVPVIQCFVNLRDREPRFNVRLEKKCEMVNNITEKGPCIYIMSPSSGEYEFQCQRDNITYTRWLTVLQELGVKLKTFQQLYDFNKIVGVGSFGKVMVGRHRPTGACVCMKSVRKSSHNVFSFYHEIAIMRQIIHPYIVQIFAAYEDQSNVYLVMEYLPGGEVFELMRKKGPFTESQAKAIMRRVLYALEYLHSRGIVHRDLKTENLLVSDTKDITSVKLIDFGLSAKVVDDKPLTMRCGSPGYVAPEILNSEPSGYGTKCDVFSAGTVLYTLLTGCCPFKAEDNKAIIRRNARCDYDLSHPVWNQTSSECKDLLRWMMNRNATLRCSASDALRSSWFNNSPTKRGTASTVQRYRSKSSCHSTISKGPPRQRAGVRIVAAATNNMLYYVPADMPAAIPSPQIKPFDDSCAKEERSGSNDIKNLRIQASKRDSSNQSTRISYSGHVASCSSSALSNTRQD